jgi:hypothetical protein
VIKRQQPLTLSPKNGLIEEGPARAVLVVVGRATDIRPLLAKFGTWEEKKITDPASLIHFGMELENLQVFLLYSPFRILESPLDFFCPPGSE